MQFMTGKCLKSDVSALSTVLIPSPGYACFVKENDTMALRGTYKCKAKQGYFTQPIICCVKYPHGNWTDGIRAPNSRLGRPLPL